MLKNVSPEFAGILLLALACLLVVFVALAIHAKRQPVAVEATEEKATEEPLEFESAFGGEFDPDENCQIAGPDVCGRSCFDC